MSRSTRWSEREAKLLVKELVERDRIPETAEDELLALLGNGRATQALERVDDYL